MAGLVIDAGLWKMFAMLTFAALSPLLVTGIHEGSMLLHPWRLSRDSKGSYGNKRESDLRSQSSRAKAGDIRKDDWLIFDIAAERDCTKVTGWKYVQSHHSYSELGLVVVKLVPLSPCESTVVLVGVVVADFANYDDTAIVAVGGCRIEYWKTADSSLRNSDDLEWNPVALETRGGTILCRSVVSGEYQNRAGDRRARDG